MSLSHIVAKHDHHCKHYSMENDYYYNNIAYTHMLYNEST